MKNNRIQWIIDKCEPVTRNAADELSNLSAFIGGHRRFRTKFEITKSTQDAIFLCALPMSLVGPVFAQAYPAKPIRIVIPYPPGGGTDIVIRAVSGRLSERLGQPVVVDNRGGATGRTRAVNRVPACGM
jgi:hypothetical protein